MNEAGLLNEARGPEDKPMYPLRFANESRTIERDDVMYSKQDSDTTQVFRPASNRCGTVGTVSKIDA